MVGEAGQTSGVEMYPTTEWHCREVAARQRVSRECPSPKGKDAFDEIGIGERNGNLAHVSSRKVTKRAITIYITPNFQYRV
jgi:hypothetical protein